MTAKARQLLDEIRSLPAAERVQLLELVIRDLAGVSEAGPSVVGLFADAPELIHEVEQSALSARGRDPLRRGGA